MLAHIHTNFQYDQWSNSRTSIGSFYTCIPMIFNAMTPNGLLWRLYLITYQCLKCNNYSYKELELLKQYPTVWYASILRW